MKHKFKIDFIEFSFLVEACIPSKHISTMKSIFFDKVINEYYHQLSENEKLRLYDWINKNWTFKDNIINNNEDCLIFNARYNPNNQYLIESEFDNKIESNKCFLYNDEYYKEKNIKIQKDRIKGIVKI